jgi:hypothetical protein
LLSSPDFSAWNDSGFPSREIIFPIHGKSSARDQYPGSRKEGSEEMEGRTTSAAAPSLSSP